MYRTIHGHSAGLALALSTLAPVAVAQTSDNATEPSLDESSAVPPAPTSAATPEPNPSEPLAPAAGAEVEAPIEGDVYLEGEATEPEPVNSALGSVLVTAQRREESIQSVPAPVTVLGGENIIDTGIGRSAKEVLDFVPNASAVTQGHGRPRWWIRGVGTGQQQLDFSNPVGFYLDDVFISNASATGFPLFDLERVEVLRGPQGTLWGKNTTGGAINVISRKPDFTHDGYFKYDYGRFRTNIFEGAAGAPIWDDKLAARISFHYEDHGGRFKNLSTGRRDGQLTDGASRLQLLYRSRRASRRWRMFTSGATPRPATTRR